MKKHAGGRPPKPASERLSKMLRNRVTKEEHKRLLAAAKQDGLSLSEYMRRKLLRG